MNLIFTPGEMHFRREGGYRSHKLPHRHSQPQRRKRGRFETQSRSDLQNLSFVLLFDLKRGVRFQVHLIRLSSGGNELVCEGLFSHPNEIWDLASCPFDQRIFSTVFSSGNLGNITFASNFYHCAMCLG